MMEYSQIFVNAHGQLLEGYERISNPSGKTGNLYIINIGNDVVITLYTDYSKLMLWSGVITDT